MAFPPLSTAMVGFRQGTTWSPASPTGREVERHPARRVRDQVALTARALEPARSADDRQRRLRGAVGELPDLTQHKPALPVARLPGDPLDADERGGAVAAVGEQVLEHRITLDVARVRLRDRCVRELSAVPLAHGLLVPATDLERRLHGDPPRRICDSLICTRQEQGGNRCRTPTTTCATSSGRSQPRSTTG